MKAKGRDCFEAVFSMALSNFLMLRTYRFLFVCAVTGIFYGPSFHNDDVGAHNTV